MSRIGVICASVVLAACASGIALADGHTDLPRVQGVSRGAKFKAEHPAGNRTMRIDFSLPDRWRPPSSPAITELTGDDIDNVHAANAAKLPADGETIRKTLDVVASSMHDAIRASAHNLGTQTFDGQIAHAYSYAVHGVPVTLYVRGNSQPVQSIADDTLGTTFTRCSIFHASIAIAAP